MHSEPSHDGVLRDSFPGDDLISQGLSDLAAGEETIEALLVAMAQPRLRRLGVAVPDSILDPSGRRLYTLLERADADAAQARYNALLARIVSYCQAREQDARRHRR